MKCSLANRGAIADHFSYLLKFRPSEKKIVKYASANLKVRELFDIGTLCTCISGYVCLLVDAAHPSGPGKTRAMTDLPWNLSPTSDFCQIDGDKETNRD